MPPFAVPQLRDWFAGQAVVGYLAAHAGDEIALPKKAEVAEYAYLLADCLLAERETKAADTPDTVTTTTN